MSPSGIFPDHDLEAALERGWIAGPEGAHVQPASLDLRLGRRAYRVPYSFLPGQDRAVAERIDEISMHSLEIGDSAVLERGCVYIVELEESLALPNDVAAGFNPKSSTGRLDVFARVIADGAAEFDRVPAGYQGSLFVEIAPRTFSIKVRRGSRLVQLRLRRGACQADTEWLADLHARTPLITPPAPLRAAGVPLRVETLGGAGGIIGYRARKHAGLIDVDRVGVYAQGDFWEPIRAREAGGIVLDPDDFYILASKERVTVPPELAAEMVAYDTLVGEFRVHYAGFFDPGFGWERGGTRAVLEVRSHEVPFFLDDGQIVGHLVYERLVRPPERLYGGAIGSSYAAQGLALSKHFCA